jgi:predicted outer membrane protein
MVAPSRYNIFSSQSTGVRARRVDPMDSIDKIISRFALCLLFGGLLLSITVTGRGSGMAAEPGSRDSRASASVTLQETDQRFLQAAVENALAEIELGKLAVQKSSSMNVKKFGERIVNDDGRMVDELRKLAAGKGLDLAKNPNNRSQSVKNSLSKMPGEQFDNAYMTGMLQDHKAAIAEFHREQKSAK